MNGSILVTGAGSGIGLAIADALLAQGFTVWAGARREAHLALLAERGARPLKLDVRDAAQVQAAADAVAASGLPLAGLVHNAGVGGIGVLQSWSDVDFLDLFQTNIFGVHRLTRALLPQLLHATPTPGRIVCIGSQGGSITHPFYGPYTMSKHALEAYAHCLRQELAPHGVAVSIVQPGAVATDIGANGQDSNAARLRSTPEPFAALAQAALQGLQNPQPPRPHEPESAHNRRHAAPAVVAARVLQVLQMPDPPLRHLVGTRWEGDRVIDALIDRLLDAAGSPSHEMDAAELAGRIEARRSERGL